MFSSRPLRSSDYNTLSRFPGSAEELFYIAPFAEYPWTPEQFAAATNARLSNTVFLDNEKIIGFANYYDHTFGENAFIGNVVIDPQERRRGFGKKVLEFMLDKGFNEHGFKEMRISCFSDNTPGLLLYRKLGFKPYGIEQRTNHKNEAVALVNFKITETEYQNTLSGFKIDQVATKLTDI